MSGIQTDKYIKDYLDSYKVDFQDEEEMEDSIEFILENVHERRQSIIYQKKMKQLVANSWRELLNFGFLFWGLNSLFLGLGVLNLLGGNSNPYTIAFSLAPLPFIIGIFEIVKSRDEGIVELEMTLKYNAHQIITSRLFIIGLYNLFVNLVISVLSIALVPEIIVSQLLVSWTVPYVLVTGIAFLFAMKTKGLVASGTLTGVWFACCYGLLQYWEVEEMLLKVAGLPIILLSAGCLLWAFNARYLMTKTYGREGYEIKN